MPPDPKKPIEELLEASAKARRAEFGADPKMPNPMRARLHDEIARLGREDQQPERRSWLSLFWPQVSDRRSGRGRAYYRLGPVVGTPLRFRWRKYSTRHARAQPKRRNRRRPSGRSTLRTKWQRKQNRRRMKPSVRRPCQRSPRGQRHCVAADRRRGSRRRRCERRCKNLPTSRSRPPLRRSERGRTTRRERWMGELTKSRRLAAMRLRRTWQALVPRRGAVI